MHPWKHPTWGTASGVRDLTASGVRGMTVGVGDGSPGWRVIDLASMGFILGPGSAKKRVHAMLLTVAYSRHMFVWLMYTPNGGRDDWTKTKLGVERACPPGAPHG